MGRARRGRRRGRRGCRDVLAQPVRPISASTSRSARAASTASEKSRPGCGSRSMRSSSGLSLSAVRTGHGWKVTVFICTAHTAAAGSSTTSWACCGPTGVACTITVRDAVGHPLGRVLLVRTPRPSMPSGNRWRVTGRSPMRADERRRRPRRRSAARSRLVMPASGHMSRSGLRRRTGADPSGPSDLHHGRCASAMAASLAERRPTPPGRGCTDGARRVERSGAPNERRTSLCQHHDDEAHRPRRTPSSQHRARSGAPASPRRSTRSCARPAPSAPSSASTPTPRPRASTPAGPAAPSCSPRDTKFDSHCGWPSFYSPLAGESVEYIEDHSRLGMPRVEVRCATCGSHLGHVFEGEGYDTPTDQRFCINSISMTLDARAAGAEARRGHGRRRLSGQAASRRRVQPAKRASSHVMKRGCDGRTGRIARVLGREDQATPRRLRDRTSRPRTGGQLPPPSRTEA